MTEPRLADHLDAIATDERRHAVRTLLRRTFIIAEGADTEIFTLVRRHRDALATWFQVELGYRLVVESDFARLHKMPAPTALPQRRLETRAGQPFDSRRYVLFCLVLAALEQAGDQTTLEKLSEAVRERASELEEFNVDFDRIVDRRAFTHAVRAVVDLRILDLRDGDEERFARNEGGDALYQVRHRRLAQVLSAPLPPSSVEDAVAMQKELYPDTSEGRSRRSRHRVMRLLVETPAVHFTDLTDEDRAYFTSQRARIYRQIEMFCGFDLELRAEGLAAIDPSEEATDLTFPSEGTVAHAARLLGEELVRRVRSGLDEIMTHAEIEMHLAALEERFGKYWSEEYKGDAQAHRRLAEVALDRLEAFGLIQRTEGGVRPRPSLARFATKEQDRGAQA